MKKFAVIAAAAGMFALAACGEKAADEATTTTEAPAADAMAEDGAAATAEGADATAATAEAAAPAADATADAAAPAADAAAPAEAAK